MKKIVIFVDFLGGYGGTEKVINDVLVNYKDSSEFKVSIVNFGSVSTKRWVKNSIKQINFLPFVFLRKVKGIGKIFRFFEFLYFVFSKADTVIAIHVYPLGAINMARKIKSRKFEIISWIHFGFLTSKFFSEREINQILKYSDRFISITDENTQLLIKEGYPEKNISTLYNPVKRQDRIISLNNTSFLSIGRLNFGGDKNNKEMFDAFALIKDLKWTLDIYGDGDDRKKEEGYVKELGISERVKFHGWSDNPFANIQMATALISTSTFEGFGMSMIEGMSFGIPAISTDIRGPRAFLTPENSVVYKPGDVRGLSQILTEFTRSERSFDADRVKASIEMFYEENYFRKFDKILKGDS